MNLSIAERRQEAEADLVLIRCDAHPASRRRPGLRAKENAGDIQRLFFSVRACQQLWSAYQVMVLFISITPLDYFICNWISFQWLLLFCVNLSTCLIILDFFLLGIPFHLIFWPFTSSTSLCWIWCISIFQVTSVNGYFIWSYSKSNGADFKLISMFSYLFFSQVLKRFTSPVLQ